MNLTRPRCQAVIKSPARYIGVLGNKRKVTAYFAKLSERGITEELLDKVHIPVGLDLGGQRTGDIALSIMAEIQAIKYEQAGRLYDHTKWNNGDRET